MARRPVDVKVAAIVSIALVAATLSPLLRDPLDDDFPLSTYPMFAFRRDAVQTVDYAVGLTATGERRTLRVRHLGTGEVILGVALLDRAMHAGAAELGAACRQIAARVAADAEFSDVVGIRLVSGTHDAVAYLTEGRVGREVERTRCPVRR